MKTGLLLLMVSLATTVGYGQKVFYRYGDQVVTKDLSTGVKLSLPASRFSIGGVKDYVGIVNVNEDGVQRAYRLADFVSATTQPYSTVSADEAIDAFNATQSISSGGFSGTGVAGVSRWNNQTGEITYVPSWSSLTGVPSTFTPSIHSHQASDVASGVFAPARLGTGTANAGTYLSGSGVWATFPTITGNNTGDQQLSLSGNTLTIGGTNGNSITLPSSPSATSGSALTVTTNAATGPATYAGGVLNIPYNAAKLRRPVGLNQHMPVAVARFGGYNTGFASTTATSVSYRWVITPTRTTASPVLVFGNYEMSAGAGAVGGGATNSITVKFSWYSSYQPQTFNGSTTVTIAPGATVASDPGDQILYAGTTYFLIVNVSGPRYPLGVYLTGGNEGFVEGDATGGSQGYTSSTSPGYGPVAIYGNPINSTVTTGSVGIVGTSIAAGRSGETNDFGWVRRGLDAANVYWTRQAVGGGQTGTIVRATALGSGSASLNGLTGLDYIVAEEGANNLNAYADLTAAKVDLIRFWGGLVTTGARVYFATILPRDDFTTASKTMKNDLNDWIRDGAPMLNFVGQATGATGAGILRIGQVGHPLFGYVEAADIAETARNSNVWKTGYGPDGVHPSLTGATAISAALTASMFPLY